MALKTYLDFAEDDYQYFMSAYNHHILANAMAAQAQEICEKYLKHIIDEYYEPKTQKDADICASVLHTHNIKRLIRFIEDDMDISLNKNEKNTIMAVNGYSFTARCPGDESIEADKDDIEQCAKAILTCRNITYRIIRTYDPSQSQEQGFDESKR